MARIPQARIPQARIPHADPARPDTAALAARIVAEGWLTVLTAIGIDASDDTCAPERDSAR